jgi:hypothetical protein
MCKQRSRRNVLPIKKIWRSVGSAGLVVAAALIAASPAAADSAAMPPDVAPLDQSTCAHPSLSQTLLPFGDSNLYALAPQGSFDNASGWQLAGDASILPTVQPDGSVGDVLVLPGGSQATSPPMCITSDYPTARLWAASLNGDSVFFNVQYYRDGQWTKPKDNGGFKADKNAWGLTNPMNISPGHDDGWQQVRFTLVSGGKPGKGVSLVDNFWVDPRASR